MRRKLKHSLVGLSLVAATVAAPVANSTVGAQGTWSGFSATTTISGLNNGGANTSPAFTAATTTDLGGPGVDLFVSNHAERSEWLSDWNAATQFGGVQIAAGGFDSHGAAFSDLDGDGDDDFVETSGRGHDTRVFINNPSPAGDLQAITGHGLEDFIGRGRTVLMVDVDGDADMDALIVNLDRQFLTDNGTPANDPTVAAPSELYLNDGTGTTFTKVPDPNDVLDDGSIRFASLTSTGPGTDQVIVTSNAFVWGLNTIQTNQAGLVSAIQPVSQSVGGGQDQDNLSQVRDITLGDLDGDLAPEFVVARQDDFLSNPASAGTLPIGIGQVTTSSLVSTVIQDVSADARVDNCRTTAVADYDNDADLDIFAGCSMVETGQTQNAILLNDGTGNFTIGAAGLVPDTAALGTATVAINADFNDDGAIDTYVGGGFDSQPGEDFIFLNAGDSGNNYLKIDLVGSNPDAAGAQVFVGTDKWQVRETGHRTHRGQDMKELHFGLAGETTVAPVEIQWPDGTFERCAVTGVNQTVTITQGGPNCEAQTQSGLLTNLGAAPSAAPDVGPATTTTTTTTTTTAPGAPVLLCNNLPVTVNMAAGETPTAGDDVIRGTAANDVINGLGGNDTICSLQGDDTVNGGDGFDKIFAGAGNDTLIGGVGNDLLIGGAGNDTINGNNGNDRIQGGDGVDILSGDGGPDRIAGGNGNDIIRGGTHGDELFGNLGRDQIFGDNGDDVIRGGAWLDTMNGGNGTDGCTLTDPGGLSGEVRISCETGVFGL